MQISDCRKLFDQETCKLVGWLVLFAMEKWFNVWSIDKLDKSRMSLRWRSLSKERMQDFVYFSFEKLFTTVSAAKHDNDAFYMLNVIWKFVRREDEVTEEGQWESGTVLCLQFVITLKLHQLHLQGNRGFAHREVQGRGEQFEAWSQWPDTCETRGKFFLQRVDNINTSVQVHVVRCTSRNTRIMHKLTSSQFSLPQMQLYLEGGDERKHVYD